MHKNSSLTKAQRVEIKRLYATGEYTQEQLASRYSTTRKTIQKWINRESPEDLSSSPKKHHQVIDEEYERVVLEYREKNPGHGPVRIVYYLQSEYPQMRVSTVGLLLKKHKKVKKKSSEQNSI